MIEYKSPNRVKGADTCNDWVFFAGSIEMGVAINWQEKLKNLIAETDYVILNPRRDDWDSSWVQSIDNTQFHEQVTWELNHIEQSEYVVFVFDENTKSPITLMELGYCLGRCTQGMIVCCPKGFWRKGNVDIMCERNGVPVVETIEEVAKFLLDSKRKFVL